jgi:hypothetical protein
MFIKIVIKWQNATRHTVLDYRLRQVTRNTQYILRQLLHVHDALALCEQMLKHDPIMWNKPINKLNLRMTDKL